MLYRILLTIRKSRTMKTREVFKTCRCKNFCKVLLLKFQSVTRNARCCQPPNQKNSRRFQPDWQQPYPKCGHTLLTDFCILWINTSLQIDLMSQLAINIFQVDWFLTSLNSSQIEILSAIRNRTSHCPSVTQKELNS